MQQYVDVADLNSVLDTLLSCDITERDVDRFGINGQLKVFRLAQFIIEYLLHSQEYLLSLCRNLDMEYKTVWSTLKEKEQCVHELTQEVLILREKVDGHRAMERTQGIQCRYCPKQFRTMHHLAKHHATHHATVKLYPQQYSSPVKSPPASVAGARSFHVDPRM